MFEEEEAQRLEPHEYEDDKLRHICSDCLMSIDGISNRKHAKKLLQLLIEARTEKLEYMLEGSLGNLLRRRDGYDPKSEAELKSQLVSKCRSCHWGFFCAVTKSHYNKPCEHFEAES